MNDNKIVERKKWHNAEIEIVAFDASDIITTSGVFSCIKFEEYGGEENYETDKVPI